MRLVLAFGAAALAPAGAVTVGYLYDQFVRFDAGDPYIGVRTSGVASLCLVVSTAAVLVIGAPAYLALRGRPGLRWWGAWLAGFFLAAIPFGLLSFPHLTPNPGEFMAVNGVKRVVHGVPTLAGWINDLEGVVLFGACGTLSSAVFWAVSGTGRRKPVQPVPQGAQFMERSKSDTRQSA